MRLLISAVNAAANGVCEILFASLRGLPPLVALGIIAFLTGAVMLLAYKFTSNQRSIGRAKDVMQAHVLAVRLFQDQIGVVLRSYGRILRATFGYLRLSLVPLLVMFIPLTLLLIQLEARFAYRSPRIGEPFLVTVRVAQPQDVAGVSLETPAGLALTAPLLRDAEGREVVARLEARQAGSWNLLVRLAGSESKKQLIVSERLESLSTERVSPGILARLLNPLEDPLPAGSPVIAIAVDYPERRIALGRFNLNWMVTFFVLSLLAGLALKRPLRADF
ncbi:MAG: hypothetical protein GZ088_04465 [Acidipila sp.]|nr:hypothetical protein [Acidipila sp.]